MSMVKLHENFLGTVYIIPVGPPLATADLYCRGSHADVYIDGRSALLRKQGIDRLPTGLTRLYGEYFSGNLCSLAKLGGWYCC